jgi:hypothetical protein
VEFAIYNALKHMPLNQAQCEAILSEMSLEQELRFLSCLGHELTVLARGAYEFQAPGVKDPIALRNLNEIHHRIYGQLRSILTKGKRDFDAESLASWLAAEEKDAEFQAGCIWAFDQALKRVRSNV